MSQTFPPPLWGRVRERGSGDGARRPGARMIQSELVHATPLPTLSHKGRGLLWFLLAACFLLLPGIARAAPSFPPFTGLVTDAANIIPADQKAALEAKLGALKQQTGRQLVVATIPDLQGYEISDYGYQLGRSWGVGLKGVDNGAILIVAPKEHKVRIEVGYGLEPVLTDAFSSVVIQQAIIPRFKANDMVGGISAGVDALAQQLSLPDDQAKAKLAEAVKQYDQSHRARQKGGHFPLGAVIWIVIVGVVVLSHIGRSMGRARRYARGTGGGSDWPIWLWAASEAMRDNGRQSNWGGGSSWGGSGGDSGSGGWMGGGFSGGGGGSFGGGGASGSW